MKPDEESLNQDTHSGDAANRPLRLSAQGDLELICKVLASRLSEAYVAYVESGRQEPPPAAWWSEAALKCSLEMVLAEGGLTLEQVRKMTIEHVARIASSEGEDDFAAQMRAERGGAQVSRMPDPPLSNEGIPAPFDLPRPGVPEPIEARPGWERLPDPFWSEDERP